MEEDEDIAIYATRLRERGHCFVPSSAIGAPADSNVLKAAGQRSQEADPDPGRRWRSHDCISITDCRVKKLTGKPYRQSAEYNPDAAGRERHFAPIDERIINSGALRRLLDVIIAIGKRVHPEHFSQPEIEAKLHIVSYRPDGSDAAWASPLSFHRDEEELVAVVLLGLSPNLGGGENAISADRQAILDYVRLREPFDILLLTKKNLHTVFPMYSIDGKPAYRDILLITFG